MLKMLSAPTLGLGAILLAGALLAGCSCGACSTEPPRVVRMEREHADLDRKLLYLAGRSEALLDLSQGVRAGGESPPDELRALRRDAAGLNLRVGTWFIGSDALFKSEAFMTLPPVDSPVAQPPRVDDVQIVESDSDTFYAALEEALPLMKEKCDQLEGDLAAFLTTHASEAKNKQAAR